jgi:hypothetical protein
MFKQLKKADIQNVSYSSYSFLQKNNILNNSNNIIKDDNLAVLVINNALQDDIYNMISNDFISLKDVFLSSYSKAPSNELKYMLSNNLYQLNTRDVLITNSYKIKKSINDILEYHFSKMFSDEILKIYNQIFSNQINGLNLARMEMNFNYFSPVCYIGKNPFTVGKTLIKNHVLGWFLMRKDEDTSVGGNLEIYNNSKRIVSIPYQKNCFILLLNNQKEKNNENGMYYTFTSRNTTIHSMRFIDFKI